MSTWPLVNCTSLKISDYSMENNEGQIQLGFYQPDGELTNKFLKFESGDSADEFVEI